MSEPNVLTIDEKIKNQFSNEKEKLPDYRKKLTIMKKLLKSKTSPKTKQDLEENVADIEKKIQNIENDVEYYYYLLETAEIIEDYNREMEKPVKVSFSSKKKLANKKLRKLSRKFMAIAKKYTRTPSLSSKSDKVKCKNCKNTTNFEIIDNSIYICLKCFLQQSVIRPTSSYNDIDRVNVTSKYKYDRKIHFRDSYKQYQGKQNCTIKKNVYEGLERELEQHHLLCGDADTPKEERFARVTKEHLRLFLKDLKMTKHYENINLIHYNMTGVKPDNISHLEAVLDDDFDLLSEAYDEEFKYGGDHDRCNFINFDIVLYELLRRHRHPCKETDFVKLKTIDRKKDHAETCQKLFRKLGWNFTPLF